jgi:UPF0755 protein
MMMDDLDLGYEDEDKGRHRRSRARKKKKGGRSWLALIVTLVLLGGLGLGGYLGYKSLTERFSTPDYQGQGLAETVQVEIKPGATLAEMAQTLQEADVIKSEKAFVEVTNPDARKIQPGFYKLRKQMSGEAAVLALLNPDNRIVSGVTITEGMMALDIYDRLAKELELNVEDFKTAAADPVKLGVPEWWFTRTDGKPVAKSVEGFLFPATYEFPPNTTAESALRMMVSQFLDVTGRLKFADKVQAERKISPYEGLIAASIAEAEVNKVDDLGKAARAIYNRAYNSDLWPQKILQVDAAFNYQFRLEGKDPKHSNQLKVSELNNPNNPYNTYMQKGLTPTPIGNPGENALKAAMDPPVGKWLFWVAVDQQGTTLFAENGDQHEANIRIGCQNGFLTSAC